MISFKKIIAALLFAGMTFVVQAQPMSLYHFGSVTQRYQMNPAFQPSCNVYVGFPVINSFYANVGNTALSLNNLAFLDGDTMATAFDTLRSKDPLLKAFKPGNLIFANLSLGLINFGFRMKNDIYFTYDMSFKHNLIFSFPKEIAEYALIGNVTPGQDGQDGLSIPLKHFGFKEEVYIENAFGLSKEISSELTIGGRLKILMGMANFNTKTDKTNNLLTGDSSYSYEKPVYARASMPFLPGAFAINDSTGSAGRDTGITNDPMNYLKVGGLFKNMGLAIDIGVDYRPSDLWSLSLSIVDLGFIHWNAANSAHMKLEQDSSFSGLYLSPDLYNGRAIVGRATVDSLRDYAINRFKKNTGSLDGYSTMLTWKIYAGASYFIWPEKLSIGLLSRTEMYFKRVYERVTLSANFFPARFWSTTVSYTMLNNTFSNMGVGMNWKLGPANIYLMGDYWPLVYGAGWIPYKSRMINAQVGLNLLFGCGKKIKDRPMIDAF